MLYNMLYNHMYERKKQKNVDKIPLYLSGFYPRTFGVCTALYQLGQLCLDTVHLLVVCIMMLAGHYLVNLCYLLQFHVKTSQYPTDRIYVI